MKIYEYLTYEINNYDEANLILKNNRKKINILHKYESLIWQGPFYIKVMNEKLKKANVNYIVDSKENIAIMLSMINLEIKNLAVSKKITDLTFKKINSIARQKKVKVILTEKLLKV